MQWQGYYVKACQNLVMFDRLSLGKSVVRLRWLLARLGAAVKLPGGLQFEFHANQCDQMVDIKVAEKYLQK